MYDNLTLYRLKTGELIVAEEKSVEDNHFNVTGPHSIIEEPSRDGGQPRVMLQPSIPHDDDANVELNKDMVVLRTVAPANICKGYQQALSNIIMPNSDVQTPNNVTNIASGLS